MTTQLQQHARRASQGHGQRGPRRPARQRIALFSPLPNVPSGIADYSLRLISELAAHFVIDAYHDSDYAPELGLAAARVGCRDARLFPRYHRAAPYDAIVYQMGNCGRHIYLYEMLLRYPGLVVLHDFFLADFHLGYALRAGAPANHAEQEIARCAPDRLVEFLAQRDRWAQEPGGLPRACVRRGITFNRTVLDAALGVLVHDGWVARRIAEMYPDYKRNVSVVPQGALVRETTAEQRASIRARFGLPPKALLLASFGIMHAQKCNAEVVESFAAIAPRLGDALLLFVGRDLGGGEARERAKALGVESRVRFFGHTTLDTFVDLASITDIGLNLRRRPTHGETSAALLTLLGAGVATLVTDVDTFQSYPEHVVRKLAWDGSGIVGLTSAIHELASDPGRRERLGRSALEYVRREHNWPRVAAMYADWIRDEALGTNDERSYSRTVERS